jgi:hypothetical protein
MKLHKKVSVWLLVTVLLSGAASASADVTTGRLSRLADNLIAGYLEKNPGAATLAVFPLDADEDLTKQKSGSAVSDILARSFFSNKNFTLIEPGEFNSVLPERDAQTPETAQTNAQVRLGKLMGAKLVLLGSIQKLGKKYQVSVRLVKTETGEVAGAAYEEFPAGAFREDLHIKKDETIGFYSLLDYRFNGNDAATLVNPLDSSTPRSFNSMTLCFGVLYKPVKKLVFNLDTSVIPVYSKARDSLAAGVDYELALGIMSLGAAYANIINERLSYNLGAGLSKVKGTWRDESDVDTSFLENVTITIPYIKAGIEYRPKTRLGLSFALRYDLKKLEIKDRETPSSVLAAYSRLSIQPAITLYF